MNYNMPAYTLNQKTEPIIDDYAMGGWNYGWPYRVENEAQTGEAGNGNWLDDQRGYLPPEVNAIGTAAFGYVPRRPYMSWQNSGAGFGMPVLQPNPLAETSKQVPKDLRYTKKDFKDYNSPDDILKNVGERLVDMFSRNGEEIDGIKNKQGEYVLGEPAGWIKSKSIGGLHRGTSY